MVKSIRWRFFIVIISFVLIVLGTTLAMLQSFLTAEYEQQMKQVDSVMADSLAKNISQLMYNSCIVNQDMAAYPNLLERPYYEQRQILADEVRQYPWFQLMAITDLNGMQLARSSGIEGDRRNRRWFQDYMAKQRNRISSTYYSVMNEKPVATLTHGIYDNGRLVGVMMADVEIEQLQKMIENFNTGDGCYAYLLDAEGNVVAHPDSNQVKELYNYKTLTKKEIQRDEAGNIIKDANGNIVTNELELSVAPSLKAIIDEVLKGKDGMAEYTDLDGEEYFCAYRTVVVPHIDETWSLLLVQKRSVAMAFINNIIQEIGGLIAVILLLGGLISILFTRTIIKPILAMVEATEKVKNGDMDVRMEIGRQDEFSVLADNFNRMIESLDVHQKERAAAEERITLMAYNDFLTGLPNRNSLKEYLDKWLHNDVKMGAVIFIDVDEFKYINDTFGYSVGDQLLIQISGKLLHSLGKEAFVCRQGGDEFVAVLPDIDSVKVAEEKALEIVNILGGEYYINGKRMHISGSIGVAICPNDGRTTDELLKKADSAMYAAKNAGRNCWRFYQPAMLADAYKKISMTDGLRQSLVRKELSLVYQPQFTNDGSKICAFEALIRWHSKVHGFVSPAEFIPLAEQSGLILPIGHWIMEEACRFIKRLEDNGVENVQVAVNISPVQLEDRDFTQDVLNCIKQAGINTKHLAIEITESSFMKSLEDGRRKFDELKAHGIELDLDDFGTGYSSLKYLRALPIDVVKLDKSFIDKILLNDSELEFLGCIIDMVHRLGHKVIAEGVEEEKQLACLQRFDCDYIQGYIFSRPLEADAAFELLKSKNK